MPPDPKMVHKKPSISPSPVDQRQVSWWIIGLLWPQISKPMRSSLCFSVAGSAHPVQVYVYTGNVGICTVRGNSIGWFCINAFHFYEILKRMISKTLWTCGFPGPAHSPHIPTTWTMAEFGKFTNWIVSRWEWAAWVSSCMRCRCHTLYTIIQKLYILPT